MYHLCCIFRCNHSTKRIKNPPSLRGRRSPLLSGGSSNDEKTSLHFCASSALRPFSLAACIHAIHASTDRTLMALTLCEYAYSSCSSEISTRREIQPLRNESGPLGTRDPSLSMLKSSSGSPPRPRQSHIELSELASPQNASRSCGLDSMARRKYATASHGRPCEDAQNVNGASVQLGSQALAWYFPHSPV